MKGGYETVADIKDALIDALDENVELTHKLRAALTRLSALEERGGDVEGMAKIIYEHMIELPWEEQVNMDTRMGYRANAHAVSRWLKEGK